MPFRQLLVVMPEQPSFHVSFEKRSVKPLQEDLQRQLDELLTEVSALAIRLRQDARRVQISGYLPAGGHNVLKMLHRFGTLTVPQMARLDSTSRQNIQTVVNRLEREGCVTSAPNPAHKRSELVRLTDRGVASLETISRNAEAYRNKVLPNLSEGELARATELLRSIRAGLTANFTPPDGSLKRTGRPSFEPRAQAAREESGSKESAASEENELPVSLL
jgi:DNA-binding MarR family transcriptional regulator